MDKAVSNVFENVTDAHRKAVDAVMGFNKIAVRTQGLLAGQQLAALEKVLDAGSRNLQLVSETRDPRELMARQTEVAVELGGLDEFGARRLLEQRDRLVRRVQLLRVHQLIELRLPPRDLRRRHLRRGGARYRAAAA